MRAVCSRQHFVVNVLCTNLNMHTIYDCRTLFNSIGNSAKRSTKTKSSWDRLTMPAFSVIIRIAVCVCSCVPLMRNTLSRGLIFWSRFSSTCAPDTRQMSRMVSPPVIGIITSLVTKWNMTSWLILFYALYWSDFQKDNYSYFLSTTNKKLHRFSSRLWGLFTEDHWCLASTGVSSLLSHILKCKPASLDRWRDMSEHRTHSRLLTPGSMLVGGRSTITFGSR